MASRILALLIWAAVAASLAYWGLRWLAPATPVPASSRSVSFNDAARGDVRRLLAGPELLDNAADPSAASALASRLQLIGVVAPPPGQVEGGVALLSVDGKPPRAVRAGTKVDGDMVLRQVSQRSVAIGPTGGPDLLTLDLPALPMASTGTLPPPEGLSTTP